MAAVNKAENFEPAPEPKQEAVPERVESQPVKEPVKESEPVKAAPEPTQEAPAGTENPNLAPAPEPKAKPTEDEVPEKGMTKEARDWAARTRKAAEAAQKQADTLAAERDDYKKRLDEAAATAPEILKLKADLEEKAKLIASMEDEIAVVRVESTKPYKEAVAGPMKEVNEVVDRLGAHYELAPSAILDAIKEADPSKRAEAIEEITSEANFRAYDRDELIQAAKTYAKAQKIGDELRGNAKKKLEEISATSTQEDERAMTKATEEFQSGVSEEWKSLQAKYPLLRTVEGNEAWNSHLAKLAREASSIDVNNVSAADVAKARAHAAALPEMARIVDSVRKQNSKLTEELEKANARIKEYAGTEPGAGTGHSSNGASKPASTGAADFGSNVVSRMRELESAAR